MADEGDGRRPKRQSSGKARKLELLGRLRESARAGKKLKYEVGELESVYDEVDEREYSRTVLQRQEQDWIVDDDGCGYVEDGREIFDDDLDEVSVEKSKKQHSTGVSNKKRQRDESATSGSKHNIRNMLVSMPAKKKKENQVKLEDDDLLGDIIGELDGIGTVPRSAGTVPCSADTGPRSADTVPRSAGKHTADSQISARDYVESLAVKRRQPDRKRTVLSEQCKNTRSDPPRSDPPLSQVSSSSLEEMVSVSQDCRVSYHSNSSVKSQDTGVYCQSSEADQAEPLDQSVSSEPDLLTRVEPLDHSVSSRADLFEDFNTDNLDLIMDQASREKTRQGRVERSQDSLSAHSPLSTPSSPRVARGEEDWGASSCENTNVQIDKSSLPLSTDNQGRQVLRLYYWDAWEEAKQPGAVFLFGKTYIETARSYVSCCLTVRNIDRRLFLLPRQFRVSLETGEESSEAVSMVDVYQEFNTEVADRFNIKSFKSRKTTKKYCFGRQDVPALSEYLEIRYSASYPVLPSDLVGETFSCVFGTSTSFLEIFLLDLGVKGPAWLDVHHPLPNPVSTSWCKVEVSCNKASDVVRVGLDERSDVPPVVVMTMVPYSLYNGKTKQSEVVAVACLVNTGYPVDKPPPSKLFNQHFCVVTRPTDTAWPWDLKESVGRWGKTHVERMETERALLSYLLTRVYRTDPDLVLGHDLAGCGLHVLVERLAHHRVPNWSRLGRLRRANVPQPKAKLQTERVVLTGRLLCDTKLSAQELIRCRSYDLEALGEAVLRLPPGHRPQLTQDLFKHSYSSGDLLLKSVWSLMEDASAIMRIFAELNVLPLSLQITNIAGNVMSRTLMGGRAERNEFLLLHAFHSKDYIVPDKQYRKQDKEEGERTGRRKAAYTGGLVLEPKVGLYDDLVLLMDFNSLYPSIIQEYNICFTTINTALINMEDEDWVGRLDQLLPADTVAAGILPTEIRKLVQSRREVKTLLNNPSLSPDLRSQYNIRQMALKLTANSMYGCLGFSHSRFHAKPLAAIVTEKGREILMNTKRLVESFGHEVIYGDTDSLMINTRTKHLDQVFQVGKKIKQEVNKNYRQVELDVDGVLKNMLLLKKKKYAAISVSRLPGGEIVESKEMKGLDVVRRDWSQLSAEVGKKVLDEILKDQSCEERVEAVHGLLEAVREDLVGGRVPLSLLTVTKTLSRAPEAYPDSKALPHVQVALRLNTLSARRFKQGDTVSYLVCQDGTDRPASQRAYHLEELREGSGLTVDTMYYLAHQIHPVISRLCEPIEATDAASIALCLGLDPTSYRQKGRLTCGDEAENPDLLFGKKDSEKYKQCLGFSFPCSACGTENTLQAPTRKLSSGVYIVCLERCENEDCKLSPLTQFHDILLLLREKIHQHIETFYEGWLVCEDGVCSHRKRGLDGLSLEGAYPQCPLCQSSYMRREVTSLQLYNQLCYYAHVFDLSKVAASKRTHLDPATQAAYTTLLQTVDSVLKHNSYCKVSLASVFSLFSACSLKQRL